MTNRDSTTPPESPPLATTPPSVSSRRSRRANARVARLLLAAGVLSVPAAHAGAAEILVSSAAQITAALATAQPGDTLVMTDGTWTDQYIQFATNGTAANPITLRAQTPGRVILNGTSRLDISGANLVVDGLTFRGGAIASGQHVVRFNGSNGFASNSRLTNSAIIDYNPVDPATRYFWVSVYGTDNRVDRNFFRNQNQSGVTLVYWPSTGVQGRPVFEDNHFVDRPVGTGNGFETIRIGTSDTQTHVTNALVQRNLFERTDGEMETISNKTSFNTFRNNTFRDVNGTLTLRHGRGSTVEGNFFLGLNDTNSGGVRVIGPDHVIVNNHFSDLGSRANGAISVTSGDPDFNVAGPNSNGYEPVTNVRILHNTVANSRAVALRLDEGYSSGGQSVRPSNVVIANNAFYTTQTSAIGGTVGSNFTWAGNLAGSALGISARAGLTLANPLLTRDTANVYRIAGNSPAINAAAAPPLTGTTWTAPTTDMDGQPRPATGLDVGADEFAPQARYVNHPLSASEVGPSWLKRRTMAPYHPYTTSNPVIEFEAEDFTARYDPDNNGSTWQVVTGVPGASGGVLKAPAGSIVSLPGTQDAIAEYDVAFHDAGNYTLYALARGFSTSTDSVFVSTTLAEVSPSTSVTLTSTGLFSWINLGTYTVSAAQQNLPLTLRIGRREQLAEIDRFVFLSSGRPQSVVPEPGVLAAMVPAALLLRRRRRA